MEHERPIGNLLAARQGMAELRQWLREVSRHSGMAEDARAQLSRDGGRRLDEIEQALDAALAGPEQVADLQRRLAEGQGRRRELRRQLGAATGRMGYRLLDALARSSMSWRSASTGVRRIVR